MHIPKRYLILLIVSIISLTYIYIQHDYNGLYYKPNDPPTLTKNIVTRRAPQLEEVHKFQDALLEYIKYIEEYYISVGLYFGGKTELPIMFHRNDECRLYDYIFKDITLPAKPPSSIAEKDIDAFISLLTEHVQELRTKIRENNRYNEQLRLYYKNCFKHQQ